MVQKVVPQFYFCNNFRKFTPILIFFLLLEQEIYDAKNEITPITSPLFCNHTT